MKFVLLIASTTQAVAVSPVPAAPASTMAWTQNTPYAAVTNLATKKTWNEETSQIDSNTDAGLFACVRSGAVDVHSQLLENAALDTPQSGPAPIVGVASSQGTTKLFWGQEQGDAGFGKKPTLYDFTADGAPSAWAPNEFLIGNDNTPATMANAVGSDTSGTFVTFECCTTQFASVDTASDFFCPSLVTYTISTTTISVVDEDDLAKVANRTYSKLTGQTDPTDAGGAIANFTARETDFYLSAQGQLAEDSTPANNFCNLDITNALVHDAAAQTATLTLGNGTTGTTEHVKCTWQFYAEDAKAPSVKITVIDNLKYDFQWIEWAVDGTNAITTEIYNTRSALADPYEFKPLTGETLTVNNPNALTAYAPGHLGMDFTVQLYGPEDTVGSLTSALIDANTETTLDSAFLLQWFADIEDINAQYTAAVAAFNSDAADYNDTVADIETEREEGTAEEDQSELGDKPCEPTQVEYPATAWEFSSDRAFTATKNLTIVPSVDITSNLEHVQSAGYIAYLEDTSVSTYDYSATWSRKVFGRLGQGADVGDAFLRFEPATATTSKVQYMQISAFPNDITAALTTSQTVELETSAVDVMAYPATAFPTVSSGSFDDLDELEGASALVFSAAAMVAVAASLY